MTRSGRAYLALFVANLAAVLAFWWLALDRNELASAAGALNAAGRLAALVGTYLLLVQLILRTHIPWLVRAFGKDPLKRVHTWNAYLAVGLIAAHVVLQIVGYALQERLGLGDELAVMLAYEGILPALVGSLLLGALTILALDRFRHRIAWPTWRALHLYTYAAVALSIPHILATGSDFIDAPGWAVYWVAVEFGIVAVLVAARVPPVWRAASAAGRPHPAIVAVAALVLATYLLGTIRMTSAPAAVAAPSASPRATPPPSPSTTARPTPTGPLADASLVVQGDAIDTPYGPLQVRLILASGRVADVEPVMLPSATKRSHTISVSVEPWLRKRAVAAQSADFEILSGATYTSRAYQASLESALRAAGLEQP